MRKTKGDTYLRLISAGRQLLPENGMSGLSVRRICAKAGVNLGVFHYHFKSKDDFARIITEDMFQNVIARLRIRAREGDDIFHTIRESLVMVARTVRDERRIISALLMDALNAQGPAINFLMVNILGQESVMGRLIRRAIAEKRIRKVPIQEAMLTVYFLALGPCMLYGMLERLSGGGMLRTLIRGIGPFMISDRAIEQRVDMVLFGLASGKKRR